MQERKILAGRYQLKKQIGRGGMSVVYQAYDLTLNRDIAVKVLPVWLASQGNYTQRFMHEARVVARLQHPHILQIHDFGNDESGSFIVMPLLHGGTLGQRIQQSKQLPSLNELNTLCQKLCDALQYAHDNQIIHRDIKPNNVMFDKQGSPYLLDFGIAKLLDNTQMTQAGQAIGTPAFMPPEQWRGDPISPAADQYALAILIYMLLSGRVPFNADSTHSLMYQHLHEPPPDISKVRADIPSQVNTILQKALSKKPYERFHNIQAFGTALHYALHDIHDSGTEFFGFQVNLQQNPAISSEQAQSGMNQQQKSLTMQIADTGKGRQMLVGILGVLVTIITLIAISVMMSQNQPASSVTANTASPISTITTTEVVTATINYTPSSAEVMGTQIQLTLLSETETAIALISQTETQFANNSGWRVDDVGYINNSETWAQTSAGRQSRPDNTPLYALNERVIVMAYRDGIYEFLHPSGEYWLHVTPGGWIPASALSREPVLPLDETEIELTQTQIAFSATMTARVPTSTLFPTSTPIPTFVPNNASGWNIGDGGCINNNDTWAQASAGWQGRPNNAVTYGFNEVVTVVEHPSGSPNPFQINDEYWVYVIPGGGWIPASALSSCN